MHYSLPWAAATAAGWIAIAIVGTPETTNSASTRHTGWARVSLLGLAWCRGDREGIVGIAFTGPATEVSRRASEVGSVIARPSDSKAAERCLRHASTAAVAPGSLESSRMAAADPEAGSGRSAEQGSGPSCAGRTHDYLDRCGGSKLRAQNGIWNAAGTYLDGCRRRSFQQMARKAPMTNLQHKRVEISRQARQYALILAARHSGPSCAGRTHRDSESVTVAAEARCTHGIAQKGIGWHSPERVPAARCPSQGPADPRSAQHQPAARATSFQ